MGEKEHPEGVGSYWGDENEELVKVYLSSVDGPNRWGRPLGRWDDRVEEYLSEGEWVGVGKEGVYG